TSSVSSPIVLWSPRLQPISTLFPYTTLFRSLTHYIPLKLGKYFSSYALTARWVHFLFVEKWRPLLSVRYVRSLHCRAPPLRNLRSEEHTSELQSRFDLVCRLLLEKKNQKTRE